MTREKLLEIAKPILFNTEMVKAILEGRKTVTRRLVKPNSKKACGFFVTFRKSDGAFMGVYDYDENERMFENSQKPPYAVGDYLYVRETWCKGAIDCGEESDGRDVLYVSQCEGKDDYILKAHALHDNIGIEDVVWKPSIHMPKEAARLFLKVTDARVERLQDITEEQAKAEGIRSFNVGMGESGYATSSNSNSFYDSPIGAFASLWNSTIKKADLNRYGWEANPWVWVIEFERVEV